MLLFLSYSVAMYKVNPSDVILVHDDLDRPLGKYSLKHGGSAGWAMLYQALHVHVLQYNTNTPAFTEYKAAYRTGLLSQLL